jgi:hypothetical protein
MQIKRPAVRYVDIALSFDFLRNRTAPGVVSFWQVQNCHNVLAHASCSTDVMTVNTVNSQGSTHLILGSRVMTVLLYFVSFASMFTLFASVIAGAFFWF